ncbi:MAG: hypothetical protein WDL87_02030 [Candidatus Omnitrophota bacterium]
MEGKTITFLEAKIGNKINRIENQVDSIRNFLKIIPVLRKVENESIYLHDVINKPELIDGTKLSKKNLKIFETFKKNYPNGVSRGDILFFDQKTSPRLSDAYLRFSSPLSIVGLPKMKLNNAETIYLIPGGAIFFSKIKYPIFTNNAFKFAVSFSSNAPKEYSTKFIACFLKSSLLLSYCINTFDNLDIFMPEVFRKILIPKVDFNNPESGLKIKRIEKILDEILVFENKFCSIKCPHDLNIYCQKVILHNMHIDKLAHEIDTIIYSLVNLSSSEIEIIESSLKNNRIYLPAQQKAQRDKQNNP